MTTRKYDNREPTDVLERIMACIKSISDNVASIRDTLDDRKSTYADWLDDTYEDDELYRI